uniref:Uncharacterized protein n=1 Tax=Oryza brachyantha TaxID=4533 RepID=J3KZ46_ORYBR
MPESRLAALERAAPVMAKWTMWSAFPVSPVSATATPATAPATALFFCSWHPLTSLRPYVSPEYTPAANPARIKKNHN